MLPFALPCFDLFTCTCVVSNLHQHVHSSTPVCLSNVVYRYTFGERFQGVVRVNATLQAAAVRESFLFYDVTAQLVSST